MQKAKDFGGPGQHCPCGAIHASGSQQGWAGSGDGQLRQEHKQLPGSQARCCPVVSTVSLTGATTAFTSEWQQTGGKRAVLGWQWPGQPAVSLQRVYAHRSPQSKRSGELSPERECSPVWGCFEYSFDVTREGSIPWWLPSVINNCKGKGWALQGFREQGLLHSCITPSDKELKWFKKTTRCIQVLNAAFNSESGVMWLNICCFSSLIGTRFLPER